MRLIRKRSNMVGDKIASTCVATFLARELVPGKDIETPTFVFGAEALAATLCHVSVLVTVASFTAIRSLSDNPANLQASLRRVLLSDTVASVSFRRFAHLAAGLDTHFLPLHWWDKGESPCVPSFLELIALGPFAIQAEATGRITAIMSRPVRVERIERFPRLANATPFYPFRYQRVILGYRKPESLRGDVYRPFRRLSHD